MGRWVSCDSIASINLYCFDKSNPVNLVDPLGTEPKKPEVGSYSKVSGDHVHQVATRTKKVGDPREAAPQYNEANAISTKDARQYNDPAAQKTEASINRAQWGANFDDYYPAGQGGQQVKTTSGGIEFESTVSITTTGETTVGLKCYPASSPYFEDVKSFFKAREGGLGPDDALTAVFDSARQLEDAGAARWGRTPNTPANFQSASTPKSNASSEPSVFRRGEAGLEPVKTFAPDPVPSNVGGSSEPGIVKLYSAAPGTVMDPAPNVRGTAIGFVASIAPSVVEHGVERLGGSHTTARRAGFLTSVASMAYVGAQMGLPADGIGAVPGAIIGGVIGAFAYGAEGLLGSHEPRSNPTFDIDLDPANPYPTGAQWGDPTVFP